MNSSGYTSIVVDGETIGIRFGISAVRMFLERVSSDLSLVSGETMNEIGIATLLHCGYINNCLVQDIVPDRKFGFFMSFVESAWIDKTVQKQCEDVTQVYADSKYTNKILDETGKKIDDIKKKKSLNGI